MTNGLINLSIENMGGGGGGGGGIASSSFILPNLGIKLTCLFKCQA